MAIPKQKIQLSELARLVADELRSADSEASEAGDAIMRFVECEIEIGFDVEVEVGGKVNIWAAEIGAGGTQTTSNTVRVKYQALPGVDTQAVQLDRSSTP